VEIGRDDSIRYGEIRCISCSYRVWAIGKKHRKFGNYELEKICRGCGFPCEWTSGSWVKRAVDVGAQYRLTLRAVVMWCRATPLTTVAAGWFTWLLPRLRLVLCITESGLEICGFGSIFFFRHAIPLFFFTTFVIDCPGLRSSPTGGEQMNVYFHTVAGGASLFDRASFLALTRSWLYNSRAAVVAVGTSLKAILHCRALGAMRVNAGISWS